MKPYYLLIVLGIMTRPLLADAPEAKQAPFVVQNSLESLQDIFCKSINYGLVEMNPPAMGGFVVNAINPWVDAQPEAFPKNATTHPILGKDIATYLPTPRTFLELRTFYLGVAQPGLSKAMCTYVKQMLSEFYQTQDTAFHEFNQEPTNNSEQSVQELRKELAPFVSPAQYSYQRFDLSSDFFKNRKMGAPLNPIPGVVPKYESIHEFYTKRGLYFPTFDGDPNTFPAKFSALPFADFSLRNVIWANEVFAPFRSFSNLDDKDHSFESEISWRYLDKSQWPYDSREGSKYEEVQDRAERTYKEFVTGFNPNFEDPKMTKNALYASLYQLVDDKTPNVQTVNREDRRALRMKNFNKLLVAELLYSYYIDFPHKIAELKAKSKDFIAHREELFQKLSKMTEAERTTFASNALSQIETQDEKENTYAKVRNAVIARMNQDKEKYTPEKKRKILEHLQKMKADVIQKFKPMN